MTKDEMARLMKDIFPYLESLRGAGQSEYAGGEEAFGNFNRLAAELQIDRKKILWIYMRKHLDGIVAAINGHMSQREPVYGRLGDAMVYMCLLWGMFLEDEKHANAAKEGKVAGAIPTPISQNNEALSGVENFGAPVTPSLDPFARPGASLDQGAASPATSSPEFPTNAQLIEDAYIAVLVYEKSRGRMTEEQYASLYSNRDMTHMANYVRAIANTAANDMPAAGWVPE